MKHTILRVCLICLLIAALSCSVLASCGDEDCTHEFGEAVVTTAATCTEKGSQTRTCTLCNETVVEEIPALGHTAEHTVCNTCGKTLVTVDQIIPTVSQEDLAKGLHLTVNDFTTTNTYDDTPVTSVVNATVDFYPTADGVFAYGTATMVDAEMTQSIQFYFDGMNIYADMSRTEDETTESQKVVVACGDLFSTISADPSILLGEEAMAMINKIMTIANTYIFPRLEGMEDLKVEDLLPIPDGTTLPEYMETVLTAAAQSFIDTFFTVETTNNGMDVKLDLSVLHEWNNEFAAMTIKDLIEMTGEGNYQTIIDSIPILLSQSVSDALSFVQTQTGMTATELVELLDDIVIAYTESEEVDLEAILGMPIKEMIEDEEFLATTVSEILTGFLTDNENATAEDLMQIINGIIQTVETAKIYDMIAQRSETTGEAFKAQINAAIDAMEAGIQYTISVGADGKFAGIKQTIAGLSCTVAPMDGGFSFAISGAPDEYTQLSGGIELTFAPVVLQDTSAYDAFVTYVETTMPVIDQALLEDKGYTAVADTPYVAYVEEAKYATSANRYTKRFNAQTAPFIVIFAEQNDTTHVSMMFLGQYITESFEYSDSDPGSVDLDTLQPADMYAEPTLITISVAITEE